jgi:enediyne biosynthesis protein E4
MGNDVADINHDGLPDLITLDMLSEDENVLKNSEADEDIKILRLRTGRYGYNYQFTRNMLQLNRGNGQFSEVGLLCNVSATDWSWSALFCDFDHDGHQDLFVSNGIPRRPNDLDYIKYVSSEQVVNVIGTTNLVDEKALAMMPSGKVSNFIFKGSGDLAFENKSQHWLPDEKTCSTATSYADLDNDGDLDLIVNNVDDKPGIYINKTDDSADYLKIKLSYAKGNAWAIGSRVYCYHQGKVQLKEMYTVRGFQSSSEPIIHFGFPKGSKIDSLKVIWPDGRVTKLTSVKSNQNLVISSSTGEPGTFTPLGKSGNALFEWIPPQQIGLDFRHVEDNYTDFDRLKLLPYQQSDRGPATAVGDINNDGRTDIYFGGSKQHGGRIFLQADTAFQKMLIPDLLGDSIKEDVDAVIADFNGDKKSDLVIGTGGADFFNQSRPLTDSYYSSSATGFKLTDLEGYFENASTVVTLDFDGDNDLDLFIGNQSVSNDFGAVPRSCLLSNDKGKFTAVQQELFDGLGMVSDAVADDVDADGDLDLLVTGEWMEPIYLKNDAGIYKRQRVVEEPLNGLWQCVVAFDIDEDGDKDYVLGNWGLNSKLKASKSDPMKMYYADFDENGQTETIVTIRKEGKYYPLDGFDIIAAQMPSLRKKFTSYKSFAGKDIDEIFSDKQLEKAKVYEVHQLASGYLKNNAGKFTFVAFPAHLQTAPVMALLRYDFDKDGREEVLAAGNYFGVQPIHGRYGSFAGAVIKKQDLIIDGLQAGLKLLNHSVRDLNVISLKGKDYLIVTINNGSVQTYKLH